MPRKKPKWMTQKPKFIRLDCRGCIYLGQRKWKTLGSRERTVDLYFHPATDGEGSHQGLEARRNGTGHVLIKTSEDAMSIFPMPAPPRLNQHDLYVEGYRRYKVAKEEGWLHV